MDPTLTWYRQATAGSPEVRRLPNSDGLMPQRAAKAGLGRTTGRSARFGWLLGPRNARRLARIVWITRVGWDARCIPKRLTHWFARISAWWLTRLGNGAFCRNAWQPGTYNAVGSLSPPKQCYWSLPETC